MVCTNSTAPDGTQTTTLVVVDYNLSRSRFLIDRRPTTQRVFVNNDGITVDDAAIQNITNGVVSGVIAGSRFGAARSMISWLSMSTHTQRSLGMLLTLGFGFAWGCGGSDPATEGDPNDGAAATDPLNTPAEPCAEATPFEGGVCIQRVTGQFLTTSGAPPPSGRSAAWRSHARARARTSAA